MPTSPTHIELHGHAEAPFILHELTGPYSHMVKSLDELFADVTRMWSQRRLLGMVFALLFLGLAVWLLAINQLVLALLFLIAGSVSATLGGRSGRHIEVEVETLSLCKDLLQFLHSSEILDEESSIDVTVDLRSALDENKTGVSFDTDTPTDHIEQHADHWFTLEVPIQKDMLLELTLLEQVSKRGYTVAGRRLSRDYKVTLFRNRKPSADSLIEGITSHIAPPSATGLMGRVREGVDAFEAAIKQLVRDHVEEVHSEIQPVFVVDAIPVTEESSGARVRKHSIIASSVHLPAKKKR